MSEGARLFTGAELLVATHNQGKAREIGSLLGGAVSRVFSAADLNLPEPEETETSFIGNAVLKARAAALASGKVALADDSGLSVTALKGDPGIYSARWAGEERDFNKAMAEVHKQLGSAVDRSATFICALALCWPDGHCETVQGEIKGTIVWPARGNNGFGYDPIFLPVGYDKTFGEMSAAEKQKISHRSRAFYLMREKCFQQAA